ncbi:hypothetical protein J2W42_000829 [Rhizobium tibeticum]|nr:hypothetical protein [Rhizobium tibeticum]MDP9807991.1 hypothetical protein [Rhizobium tibeticum]
MREDVSRPDKERLTTAKFDRMTKKYDCGTLLAHSFWHRYRPLPPLG